MYIDVKCVAASEENGSAEFTVPQQTSLSSLNLNGHQVEESNSALKETLTVETVAVDTLKLNKLDIVKIDVEGAELLVLKGMKNTILNLRPRLIMIELVEEHLHHFDAKISDVIRFMKSCGYKPYALKDAKLIPYNDSRPDNDNFFFRATG